MVEGRSFTVFTDHKSLTFAFQQKIDKCSPRQFRHLDFTGQFTADIRHVAGIITIVADTLSRVEELTAGIDFAALAKSQVEDEELQAYVLPGTGLQLKKVTLPETNITLFCDVFTKTIRPFITKSFRRTAFESLHQLSHPGIKARERRRESIRERKRERYPARVHSCTVSHYSFLPFVISFLRSPVHMPHIPVSFGNF